jgi:TfoX/Sxy family transcriptional regulator of competence genes
MFGGIAFLRQGKMFVGIVKNDLMVRVGPDGYADALKKPFARPMDFTCKISGTR